jgi:hypothetical protein
MVKYSRFWKLKNPAMMLVGKLWRVSSKRPTVSL